MVVFYSLLFEMPMARIDNNLSLFINNSNMILYKLINDQEIKILGSVVYYFNKTCKGIKIAQSVSEEGYGPLIYDLLMSKTQQPVIPSNSLTKAALNFWLKTFSMSEKYNFIDLEGVEESCQPPDMRLRNKGITIKQPLNYQQLVNNHNKNNVDGKILIKLAEELFDEKYLT